MTGLLLRVKLCLSLSVKYHLLICPLCEVLVGVKVGGGGWMGVLVRVGRLLRKVGGIGGIEGGSLWGGLPRLLGRVRLRQRGRGLLVGRDGGRGWRVRLVGVR